MADATPRPTLAEAIRKFANGREVQTGLLELDVPPLVENGNAVGVTVQIGPGIGVGLHVRRIGLFNEKNPLAEIALFHFGMPVPSPKVATRVRLATTQDVTAVAELSDGSCWESTVHVIVTLAACIEDLGP
ncbi:MAG: thiosulfate oxidation carrier protein SoxY [Steroidobacteraceae bacterium]